MLPGTGRQVYEGEMAPPLILEPLYHRPCGVYEANLGLVQLVNARMKPNLYYRATESMCWIWNQPPRRAVLQLFGRLLSGVVYMLGEPRSRHNFNFQSCGLIASLHPARKTNAWSPNTSRRALIGDGPLMQFD